MGNGGRRGNCEGREDEERKVLGEKNCDGEGHEGSEGRMSEGGTRL